MKLLLILIFFTSLHTFAQNEDKILFEKGMTLQYAHYETDLLEMMLSNDSIKSKSANKIVNQLQEQAIYQYNQFLKEFPNSNLLTDVLYQKAEALYSIGLNLEAKENFLKVISINPKKGKSLLRLASIELELKNYSEALKYIEERKKLNVLFFCGVARESELNQIMFIEEKCRIAIAKK